MLEGLLAQVGLETAGNFLLAMGIALLAGLVIVPVVSLFTRKPEKQLVDDAFSCYEQRVLVRQREALGDSE